MGLSLYTLGVFVRPALLRLPFGETSIPVEDHVRGYAQLSKDGPRNQDLPLTLAIDHGDTQGIETAAAVGEAVEQPSIRVALYDERGVCEDGL